MSAGPVRLATPADRVLIVVAGLVVGVLYAWHWTPRAPASAFEVRVGERLAGRYALDVDRELQIGGRLGVSRLEVRAGRVRFVHSPCRNKICLHSGWLSRSGDAAACLPNRLSLRLLGEGRGQLDGLSF